MKNGEHRSLFSDQNQQQSQDNIQHNYESSAKPITEQTSEHTSQQINQNMINQIKEQMNQQSNQFTSESNTKPTYGETHQQNTQKISDKFSIKVSDPQPDSTKSFMTYLISGNDSLGVFQIRRRYNDFFYLRQSLRKRWPGLYIPPIPQKKLNISGKDDIQIQYRRKIFNHFLQQLATFPHLFSCSITQQFLRNQSMSMDKYCQTVTGPPTNLLIQQYKNLFQCQGYKQQLTNNKHICTKFTTFLKNAQKQLINLISQTSSIVQSRNNFNQALHNCNITMLPQYQKNIYSQYLVDTHRDGILLFVHDQQIQNTIKSFREKSHGNNSFQHFYDMFLFQSKDVQAFLQTLQSKQDQQGTFIFYQAHKFQLQHSCLQNKSQLCKLSSGKFSLKSLFAKGTKEQQIKQFQKQIPSMQKHILQLSELYQILNHIQASVQIPRFKQHNKQKYYQMLNTTSQHQLQYLTVYGQLMKSIMEGLNKKTLGEQ